MKMQDYEELLTELEELIASGKKSMFGNTVTVNPDALYAVIDKLRENMPMMLREASYIKNDLERRRQEDLKRAQDIVETAKNRAAKLVEENTVLQEAYREAEIVKREALDYRDRIVKEGNANLQSLLSEAKRTLEKGLEIVEGDIAELRRRQYSDEFNGN